MRDYLQIAIINGYGSVEIQCSHSYSLFHNNYDLYKEDAYMVHCFLFKVVKLIKTCSDVEPCMIQKFQLIL